MPRWLENVLALIAGVLAGGATVAAVEALGHGWLQGQAQFVVASVGLGVATLMGGSVSAWISKAAIIPLLVAAVLTCLMVVNVFSFPHPVWFLPAALMSIGAGSAVVWRLFSPKGATA
ncbi:MAG: hypothetical protein AB8B96_05780 [Lysobacterales bacterium]